jgi:hypothetical protein
MKKYKVYCLRDKSNQIKYIGQTRQTLKKRYDGHKHSSSFRDNIFTIELIADFDNPEPMYKLEGMLIEQYKLIENGWNRAEGYIDCPKQFDGSGEKNGFYGHKHRKEVCDSIGKRSINNSYAKGNKSRRGRKNSEYHNKRISETHQKPVMCVETGIVYKSGREAAKKLGLQRSKISNVCLGRRRTTGGFHFVFVNE